MIYSRLTFQQPETLNHYRFQQTTVYCLMHISTYPMNSHNCRKYIWTVAENAYACKLKLVLDIDSYWRNVHRRMHLHLHINSCLWPLIMSTVVGNYADDTPNYSRKMHAWGAWKKKWCNIAIYRINKYTLRARILHTVRRYVYLFRVKYKNSTRTFCYMHLLTVAESFVWLA